jgi:hypothetical protein
MRKSRIFYTDKYKKIQREIVTLLNSQPDFLSSRTAASTRAAGDAIQTILSEQFQSLLGDSLTEYSPEFARRAMADMAFSDKDGFYYVVDVKTHRRKTGFSMPNLTSVERLARFYEDDRNYFVVLLVQYDIDGIRVTVEQAHFLPIEFPAWDCLTIGALGWGQIQIKDASVRKVNEGYPRKKWMIELCDTMLDYYPREIGKIKDRLSYFQEVRRYWQRKKEN